ncbi:MAG: PucR family transcriptional regulator ligand-binding domain-containing protein [Christensenellaceae bacterium]
MQKTITEILLLSGFKNAKVVAGNGGVTRLVDNATLMEVPDIVSFVEVNTLLITTLFPIAEDITQIANLIPQLNKRGAAGICIKPLRYIDRIPSVMFEQANALDFPIIELPEGTNLATLANQILSVSLNDRIAQLQFRDAVHQGMMELLLGGASAEVLLCKLSELLCHNIILLDNDFGCVCAANFNRDRGDVEICNGAEISTINFQYGIGNFNISMFPIKAGNKQFGYVYIPEPAPDDENVKMAMEQAAMLLATVFFKENAVLLNQRNFKDVFIRDLLQGKIATDIEMENKSKAFNLSLHFPGFIVCVQLFTQQELIRKRFYNELIDRNSTNRELSSLYRRNQGENVVYFNDGVVILEKGESEQQIQEFYHSILKPLEHCAGEKSKIGIGISRIIRDYRGMKEGYGQALNMVRVGNTLNPESFVSLHSENSLFEILESITNHTALRAFINLKLKTVIEYDQKNGTDFLDTFRILIHHGFNGKKAAESTYVHYNTMRYRIGKLRQLGVELDPGRALSETILAYYGYLWLKSQKQW